MGSIIDVQNFTKQYGKFNMMKKIKNNGYDISINILCLAQLIGIIIYLVIAWNGISDKIPRHYNASGVIDRWGNKGELIMLPIISWILYLIITAAESSPKSWNTGITVTEENRTRVYRILKNMIVTLKLVTVTTLTFITVNSSLAKALPTWFLPVCLCLLFVPIVVFYIRLIKSK